MKMNNLWLVSPKIFPSADATARLLVLMMF